MRHHKTNIEFIGNARDIVHAMHALEDFNSEMSLAEQPYDISLYGSYPKGLFQLSGAVLNWIGSIDEYGLYRDSSRQNGRKVLASSIAEGDNAHQHYYRAIMQTDSVPPPSFPETMPGVWSGVERIARKCSTGFWGNTVFLMPPSPQDDGWRNLIYQVKSFDVICGRITAKRHSITYPQVRIEYDSDDQTYDHSLFYFGDQSFPKYCMMPSVKTLDHVVFEILRSCMYVGWSNWMSDIAMYLGVPSIIFCDKETIYDVPFAHVERIVSEQGENNADQFDKAYERLCSRINLVPRPVCQ